MRLRRSPRARHGRHRRGAAIQLDPLAVGVLANAVRSPADGNGEATPPKHLRRVALGVADDRVDPGVEHDGDAAPTGGCPDGGHGRTSSGIHTYMSVRKVSAERSPGAAVKTRPTQADRSARTRDALLESAAQGLSRYGYGSLVLERVASEAGYTRGAIYHQFKDKQELALAVIAWIDRTWHEQVAGAADREPDPVAALITLARGHAIYCRRDVARVMMVLRVEFSGQDHPVGHELERIARALVKRCARLVEEGRRAGSIPSGPPAAEVARAYWGALEGAVIAVAGKAPHDELLAARAAAGVLGLDHGAIPPMESANGGPGAGGHGRSAAA